MHTHQHGSMSVSLVTGLTLNKLCPLGTSAQIAHCIQVDDEFVKQFK